MEGTRWPEARRDKEDSMTEMGPRGCVGSRMLCLEGGYAMCGRGCAGCGKEAEAVWDGGCVGT